MAGVAAGVAGPSVPAAEPDGGSESVRRTPCLLAPPLAGELPATPVAAGPAAPPASAAARPAAVSAATADMASASKLAVAKASVAPFLAQPARILESRCWRSRRDAAAFSLICAAQIASLFRFSRSAAVRSALVLVLIGCGGIRSAVPGRGRICPGLRRSGGSRLLPLTAARGLPWAAPAEGPGPESRAERSLA